MRDSIGGVFNLTFIAVFMLVVSGYLAFSVSYNKAFKVKNRIISILEQNEGYNSEAKSQILDYMKAIGYNADTPVVDKSEKWNCPADVPGMCIKWTQVQDKDTGLPKGYYSVKTAVYIDVPVFNKFLPFMTFFQTQGDTMTINGTND
ncbi:MAG: hypothetical protein Q4E39_01885 [bacterium]|nr:hypothetical protein [bacterium]